MQISDTNATFMSVPAKPVDGAGSVSGAKLWDGPGVAVAGVDACVLPTRGPGSSRGSPQDTSPVKALAEGAPTTASFQAQCTNADTVPPPCPVVPFGSDIFATLHERVVSIVGPNVGIVRGRHSMLTPGLTHVEQWLKWENDLCFASFQRSDQSTMIPLACAPVATTKVVAVSGFENTAQEIFAGPEGSMLWPKHPDNTLETVRSMFSGAPVTVPYFNSAPVAYWAGGYTASRSTLFISAHKRFLGTVKMPTNRPNHGAAEEPHKVDLTFELEAAVRVSSHITAADARAGGPHPDLEIIRDTMAIIDAKTQNGSSVRELTPILNDTEHLIMPGMGIMQLAEANGWTPEEAVALEAKLSGKKKALYLLRYGRWMDSPHGQNTLYQLGVQPHPNKAGESMLVPTGKVLLRDVGGDSGFVEPIARALGFTAAVDGAVGEGAELFEKTPANDWPITIAGMDASGFVSYTQLINARPLQDLSFCDTVRAELRGLNHEFDAAAQGVDTIEGMDCLLRGAVGQRALAAYGKVRLRNPIAD